MKRLFTLWVTVLALMLCAGAASAGPLEVEVLTGYTVDVYGEDLAHWSYARPLDRQAQEPPLSTLRSAAALLSGTPVQFDVAWDQEAGCVRLTSGVPYGGGGAELTPPPAGTYTAAPASTPVYLDGERLALSGWLVEGRHCYPLNALAAALGAEAYLDREKGCLAIRPAGTLYTKAVEDARTVEPEEVLPLKTSLTRDNPYAVWNEAGDKVLVCTWNDTPDTYPDGSSVTVGPDPVWVFSGAELADWLTSHSAGVTDWDLRLRQLIGLPPDTGYSHVTALWAAPEDLLRPAFDPDPEKNDMTTALAGDAWFRAWFQDNTAASYGEDGYPWTRLGYTYDWAGGGTEYGLTEFILRPGAEAAVDRTLTTEDYLDSLAEER